MKNSLLFSMTMLSFITLNSCAAPNFGMQEANSMYPQSYTETHTKTVMVAPPSYSMPAMPSSNITPNSIYQPSKSPDEIQKKIEASI